MEIEFDPSLDAEFGVTTSKQQITISDRIWTRLEQEGFWSTFKNMRKLQAALRTGADEERDARAGPSDRPSTEIMEKTTKALRLSPGAEAKRLAKGEENAHKLAERRAAAFGRKVEEELNDIRLERRGGLFEVQFEELPNAPFFRVEPLGGAKVLHINRSHRFYTDLYRGSETSPRLRTVLELLLFAIGDAMADATDEASTFYTVELMEWPQRLAVALNHLSQTGRLDDDADARLIEEEEASMNDDAPDVAAE